MVGVAFTLLHMFSVVICDTESTLDKNKHCWHQTRTQISQTHEGFKDKRRHDKEKKKKTFTFKGTLT